jgi:flagellar motor component MotA
MDILKMFVFLILSLAILSAGFWLVSSELALKHSISTCFIIMLGITLTFLSSFGLINIILAKRKENKNEK